MDSTMGVSGPSLAQLVRYALAEDLGDLGDVTSQALIPADAVASGRLVSRVDGIFAGHAVGHEVIRQCGLTATWHLHDGDQIHPRSVIAEISGTARAVLSAERTLLNFISHLSGVATMTRSFVDVCGDCAVLDTRKTTPGLRALEKAAVVAGGGQNHRFGLFDRILVKDNHLALAGAGLGDAVRHARTTWPDLLIEVEADDLDGVRRALAAEVDWILLDNMTIDQMRAAVAEVAGRALLEGSGRMDLTRAREASACGIDALSVGALTHSAPIVDIGLDLDDVGAPPAR